MEQANVYIQQLINICVEYAPKVAMALLVLVVGWLIINRLTHFFNAYLKRANFAPKEVESFIQSIVNLGLKVLLVISVAGILGIETTSVVGIIAAMSFAIGLALQGNLSNFAAGIMILVMRPFKVGDEVKIQGIWAFVKEIQIFHTVLSNFDKTETIIPNSSITSGYIQNLSASPIRKISIKLNVPYNEDLLKVKNILIEAAYSVPEIDSSKQPFFWIQEFGDHFIKISIGFDTSLKGYWVTDVKVKEAIVSALNDNAINVAYPTGVAFGKYGGQKDAVLN